ncbi:hypothetical protein [Methanobrevibacter sp.]|uniref:hypothetical protein n=1 Tax=Methanobrevibacter sp. TaxID=66852 RepID=UPI00388D8EC3
MTIQTLYSCDKCEFEFQDSSGIFWVDVDGYLHVDALNEVSSHEASQSLLSGGVYQYYCYNCENVILKFDIRKIDTDVSREAIIQLLENYNDAHKIIEFDPKFQNCIECGEELSLKMEKVFVVDKNDEFLVDDSIFNYDALDKISNKFWGKYYGYYCRDCSKQINKFVIVENSDNLSDDEIKSVLHDHTNDLTVFINNPGDICPNCGNKIQILKEFSPCPNCGEGKLRIKDIN